MSLHTGQLVAGLLDNKKGVVVDIWEDDQMPFNGEYRADVIMDGDSIGKRMNLGALVYPYVADITRYVGKEIKHLINDGRPGEAWDYLQKFYDIASPWFGDLNRQVKTKREDRDALLKHVYNHGIDIVIPPNSPLMGDDLIRALNEHYPLAIKPVTYQPPGRPRVTTKERIRIAPNYLMFSEKNGSTWAAVSSATRSHFGVLAKLTASDRHALPYRPQPPKFLGESEVRALVSTIGPDTTAWLLDKPNNPTIQRYIAKRILTAENPSHLQDIRQEVEQMGVEDGRHKGMVMHMLMCSGMEFRRDKIKD